MNSMPIFLILFAIVCVHGGEDKHKQNGGNGNDSTIHHNPKAGGTAAGNVGSGSKVTHQIHVVGHKPSRGLKSLEDKDTGSGVLSNHRVVETKIHPATEEEEEEGTVPVPAMRTAAEEAADKQKQVEEYISLMHLKHKQEKELEEAHEETVDRRGYEHKLKKAENVYQKQPEYRLVQSEARVSMQRNGNAAQNHEDRLKAELAKTEEEMAKYPASVAEEANRQEQNRAETLENGLYSFSEPFEVDNDEYGPQPLKPHDDGRGAKDVVGTPAHQQEENHPIVSNAHDDDQEKQAEHDALGWRLAGASDPFA